MMSGHCVMIIEKGWVEKKTSQFRNLRKLTGVGLKATNLGIVIARHAPCLPRFSRALAVFVR